jgi:hypothetical protein
MSLIPTGYWFISIKPKVNYIFRADLSLFYTVKINYFPLFNDVRVNIQNIKPLYKLSLLHSFYKAYIIAASVARDLYNGRTVVVVCQ